MNKTLYFLLLLLAPALLKAETVKISGFAEGFESRKISILRFEDPYSGKVGLIMSSFTDEKGNFNVEFELDQTAEILIRVALTTARMYASPGSSYELTIPDDGKQVRAIHERSFLDVDLENVPRNDVNVRIAEFNNAYDRFFQENYVEIAKASYPGGNPFKNARNEDLDGLIVKNDSLLADKGYEGMSFPEMVRAFSDSMHSAFANDEPFVRSYAIYSLGDIELKSGISKDSIFERYLAGPEHPWLHPQFAEFASAFYFRFFDLLQRWGADPKPEKAINDAQSIRALYESLESSNFSDSDDHAALAATVGLKGAYYERGKYNKAAIIGMLGQMDETNSPQWAVSVAQNLKEEMKVRTKDSVVPELELLNTASERTTWDEFKGELVYVIAVANWSTSSQEELTVLSRIADKYSREARFVVLSMDADFKSFKEFVSRNHRNKWTFLYGMSDPLVREKLDIWSLPTSFLISPEGKYLEANMPLPSRGLEAYFYKMNADASKRQKLKVWDD